MPRFRAILAALLFTLPLPACVAVPPDVKAEFSAPDGKRPNHYHTCRDCAKARRAGARVDQCVAPAADR